MKKTASGRGYKPYVHTAHPFFADKFRAGDAYPVTESMIADGVGTMITSLFGSPFGTVMYFGHPAYKKSGAKTGYRCDTNKQAHKNDSKLVFFCCCVVSG